MKSALNQFFLINNHVVTKIIKTEFVIRDIGDVTVICLTALVIVIRVQDHADGEAQPAMYGAHPLRITVSQVVIDRNDVNALSLQCIQISGKCGHQGFTFTGTHLGDTALMQDHTTDQLHTEGLQAQYTIIRLTHNSKGLRKKVIQCLSCCQSFLKFCGFCL